jgi:hypothetical protein
MRFTLVLRYIAFVSGAWTIAGFAARQRRAECCHRKRKVSGFVMPNDSLELGFDSKPISASTGAEKLQPFLPAADPRWACIGSVGRDNFVVTREGGPTEAELSNQNILKIVKIECSDLEVNTIVWKCLGYRFNSKTEEWTASECFPKWREKYPMPPDLIGMQRMYVNLHFVNGIYMYYYMQYMLTKNPVF